MRSHLGFYVFVLIILALLILVTDSTAQQQYSPGDGGWVQTNGPEGGTIAKLTVNVNGDLFACNNGVFRSTDGGQHWMQLNLGVTSPSIHAIQTIGDAVVLIWLEADSARGLFRSLDNGRTWTFLCDYSAIPKVGCLTADSDSNIFAGTKNGVYVSSNLGITWVREDSTFQKNVYSISISKCGDLFAGTIADGGGMRGDGVYRTTNRGVNWLKMSNGITHNDIVSLRALNSGTMLAATNNGSLFVTSNGGQEWERLLQDTYIDAIVQNSEGELWLATRTKGLWRSTNDGATWASTNLQFAATALVGDNQGNLYAGVSKRGVMKSLDKGDSWFEVNRGLVATSATTLHLGQRGDVWAGTTSGLYHSTNKGATWLKQNLNNFEVPIGAIITTSEGYILVGTRGKGIFLSSNHGGQWVRLDTTMFSDVSAMVTDSRRVIYAISKFGVSRSIDNGTSWTIQFNGFRPRALAFGACDAAFIGADDGVYRSTDQGTSWSRVLRVGGIRQMAADQRGDVFVSANTHGLGMSFDNGENWSFAQVGELTDAVTVGKEGEVFVSTGSFHSAFSHGVFHSRDRGTNWVPSDAGLTNRRVISLAFGNGGDLFAGTSGSGVFKYSVSFKTEPGLPTSYSLSQNYPNPFNPTTIIAYDLPQASNVRLKVFDILGREVETLVERDQNAGHYEFAFDASRLSSGTYFYRLDAGAFVQTKKMLIVR